MNLQFAIARPGPGRMTLALLALVPAALAYPYETVRERWVLAIAVLLLIVLLSWWNGLHLTTLLRRRIAMLRHRRGVRAVRRPDDDTMATVLFRLVESPEVGRVTEGPGVSAALPLDLLAGYLDRYGLRANAIRVTSRDVRPADEPARRDTWIGLTYSATANLGALQARSADIPLAQTALVAGRRLADHLRELGWESVADNGPGTETSGVIDHATAETWHGLTTDDGGAICAYRLDAAHDLAQQLNQLWHCGAPEVWTVVEMAQTQEHRTVAAGCALRTALPPKGPAPLSGLIPQHGNHLAALRTLAPTSWRRLDGHVEFADDAITALRWPIGEVSGVIGENPPHRREPTPAPRPNNLAAFS